MTKILTSSKDFILTLYSQPQTVFTLDEISLYFPGISYDNLRSQVRYFTNVGKLKRIHQGIYAKINYDPLEFAGKLYKPAYISLETVLVKGGVVFQYYERIFVVSYLTREVSVGPVTIQYRRIKDSVLVNTQGIEQKAGYSIAILERAFMDAVFIYKDYHFDNLGSLNWEKVFELQPVYQSKAFDKRIREYYQDYKEDYGK